MQGSCFLEIFHIFLDYHIHTNIDTDNKGTLWQLCKLGLNVVLFIDLKHGKSHFDELDSIWL